VSFDESRLTRVVARVSGYVEKLYVNKTYSVVREGESLAEIYSPQLYSTAQELLIALGSQVSSDLAPVARDRLRLFGVSDAEIDEIARSRAARPRLVIRSPRSGYVIAKKIEVGSSVEPGMTLLDVADLSAVWIEADVFEKNVSLLKPGQTIEATVEALPNITFNGRVALIYPELQTATRTNRVRFELDNPGGALRPGMFATVRIDTALEAVSSSRTELPVVPERAVVDTGVKKIVYVEREPGLFEGVQVELGPRVQIDENSRAVDYYPVLKGLEPGQRIADAGSFLIDAETRLNPAAASTYFGASGGPQGGRDESSGGRQPERRPDAPAEKTDVGAKAGAPTAEETANIAQLPEEDRQLALGQRACPITGAKLGSMGVPYKVVLKGQPVLLCCPGCEGKAKDAPDETLEKVARLKSGKSP
jgi:Cu(I)/Ag(I) efflux system membrane fusion protein